MGNHGEPGGRGAGRGGVFMAAVGAGSALVAVAGGVLLVRGLGWVPTPSPALAGNSRGHGEAVVVAPSVQSGPTVGTTRPTNPSAATAATQPAAAPPDAVSRDSAPPPAGLPAATLYERTAPGVVRIEVRDDNYKLLGHGSGFFVSPDGLLVTNHHVIAGAKFATAETTDGTTLFVEGVAADDPKHDVAVLKVKGEKLTCLTLAAERPAVGTKVYAVGHPMGLRNAILSEGLVSGVGDESFGGGVSPLQTSAPISPGSSGGPLVTADGKVIGITSGALRPDISQNLNVAMPVSVVNDLLKTLGPGGGNGSGARKPVLKPLASAGTRSLDQAAAAGLRNVWAAMDAGDRGAALDLLAGLKPKLGDSLAYWMTAGSLHIRMGNFQLAADAYANASRVKPDCVEAQGYRGAALEAMGNYAEAIKAFETAGRLAPKDPKSYASAAGCYMALDRPAQAVPLYKWAIKLSPSSGEYKRRLGLAYARMDQSGDAMMCFVDSIKARPNDAETHADLAEAYMKLGRADDAFGALQKAVSLRPSNARAHGGLALIHLERGRVPEALYELKYASRCDPSGPMGAACATLASLIEARQQQQATAQQQALKRQLLEQPATAPQTGRGRKR